MFEILTHKEIGDKVYVYNQNNVLLKTYDAIELAMIWFRCSNDSFFNMYGFNYVPTGDNFTIAKRNVELKEKKQFEESMKPKMSMMGW